MAHNAKLPALICDVVCLPTFCQRWKPATTVGNRATVGVKYAHSLVLTAALDNCRVIAVDGRFSDGPRSLLEYSDGNATRPPDTRCRYIKVARKYISEKTNDYVSF